MIVNNCARDSIYTVNTVQKRDANMQQKTKRETCRIDYRFQEYSLLYVRIS